MARLLSEYMRAMYLCSGAVMLLNTACGAGSKVGETSGEALVISANELYQAAYGESAELRQKEAAATAAMTIPEYYITLLARGVDQPLIIDGVQISGLRTSLMRKQAFFANLAQMYPSVGAYWKATNYDPTKNLGEASFSQALRRALTPSSSSLGLAGDLPAAPFLQGAVNPITQLPSPGASTNAGPVVTADCHGLPSGRGFYGRYQAPGGYMYVAGPNEEDVAATNFKNMLDQVFADQPASVDGDYLRNSATIYSGKYSDESGLIYYSLNRSHHVPTGRTAYYYSASAQQKSGWWASTVNTEKNVEFIIGSSGEVLKSDANCRW